ncbi:MAG: dihydroorotase, partial [Planctomycetaceae bacterium]|nr:dihydroorotase [Planctomycetaceae bacterium]
EVVIDARGLIVCPGLIDVHVHLREPGNEEDETIATGAAAALAGGVTSVACMPNTIPPIDTQAAAEFVVLQGLRARQANVYPVGAVSKGRKGEELASLGQLVAGGAVAFTDDGAPVASAALMRRALEYSRMFDRVIMQHCQVPELTAGGVMNEGFESTRLGLAGMPAAGEDIMVARDIRLAEITAGRLHIQHISTARSVELVREGKQRGVKVTAEACPHHFSLTDERLRTFDSNYKMNPPLRTLTDVEAVVEGLKDGTIEVLATDHAPHAPEKKMRELDLAPFGIIGVETLVPITVTKLIDAGHLTWPEVIRKLTINPAQLLGIPKGTLRPGADADVTLIDPAIRWTIDPSQFRSKSRNCPFAGWEVSGRAHTAIVGGDVRYTLSGILQQACENVAR